ncbi:hypothetical protein GGR34_000740 [Microvirga flocculans]|uniref:Uncharacterized protein n=1 Tax=Microvirga flocculans TaxID=217168 RepID=A0A7W6N753_9HYPH|nr:hypothetical protein [Microvirga flocculans]
MTTSRTPRQAIVEFWNSLPSLSGFGQAMATNSVPPAIDRLPPVNGQAFRENLRREMGMPNGAPPSGGSLPGTRRYPMAEDPMTAGGSHYATGSDDPMGPGAYPSSGPQRITPRVPRGPIRRPPAHTAPASPGPAQAAPQVAPRPVFDGGDGWISPDQAAAQNRALLEASASGAAGPQFQAGAATTLAGMNPNVQTSYASGSGNPPPGSGLLAFLNSGAMPVFKASEVGPTDWQGPVLPHENTGKRVGVVEGSVAHQFQESPMGKLAGLFGINPFGM